MTNILAFTFVIIMLVGITLTIINRKNKGAIVIIVLCIFAVGLPIFFLLNNELYKLHKAEINRVIELRGGRVESIQKEESEKSPFNGASGSGNTIYEITYEYNNQKLIAWYRGTNVMNDIHAKPSKGYEEKWIFNELNQ
ncbi:hypothetical protein ACFQZR_13595 [Paenibacillus sp. GCM10027629]|uniref:hypothetical protein n=1 Tax=Paenibacillus sp. GCM10027629 TaxID=3273414 RepID=UPI0036418C75